MMLLGGVLLALIVVVVFALYFAGARVSLHTTARLCLWEKLREAGLAGYVEPACVNEIADHLSAGLVLVAQGSADQGAAAQGELVARLDLAVAVVRNYLIAAAQPVDASARAIELLLGKYGIAAGSAREALLGPQPQ
jgi:hypothetical protein